MKQESKTKLPEELLDEIADKIQENIYDEIGTTADIFFSEPELVIDEDGASYIINFEATSEPYKDLVEDDYFGITSYHEEVYDGIDANGYVIIQELEDGSFKFDIFFDRFKRIHYYDES